jgi:hypothetical protein
MSLKAFHIVFVTLSSILAFVFAVWEFSRYQANGEFLELAWALLAFASGAGLIFYGIRFLKKLRKVSFI